MSDRSKEFMELINPNGKNATNMTSALKKLVMEICKKD